MLNRSLILTAVVACTIFVSLGIFGFMQQSEPWRADQLMNPADLAAKISDSKSTHPVIVSVGPGGVIPNSVEIGPGKEPANLKSLETKLSALPKDSEIVLYCGCCPFAKCPNIRPAFTLMNTMGFKNHKLLDLPHNIKADWIDQGYPAN